jgi:hypothetical protein
MVLFFLFIIHLIPLFVPLLIGLTASKSEMYAYVGERGLPLNSLRGANVGPPSRICKIVSSFLSYERRRPPCRSKVFLSFLSLSLSLSSIPYVLRYSTIRIYMCASRRYRERAKAPLISFLSFSYTAFASMSYLDCSIFYFSLGTTKAYEEKERDMKKR